MSDRLSLMQIVVLCGYAAGMAGGQVLFKLAALRFAGDAPLAERLLGLAHNWIFLLALVLYLALGLLWLWILSFTPLSRAYPFVALAFAITPVLANVLFAEPMTVRLAIGIAVVLCGLILVTG
jgi:drug/metabolite transporter (DMT)-like permease